MSDSVAPVCGRVAGARRAPGKALVAVLLAFLGVCLIGVFVVLPKFVSTPQPVAPQSPPTGAAVAPEADAAAGADPSSPQALRARKAAQDVLEKVVAARQGLRERQVQDWAAADYQRALDAAARGDEHYAAQRFDQAAGDYELALSQLTDLQSRAEQALTEALEAGRSALASGDAATARSAFELALKIEPGHDEAQRGITRAGTLDQVMALIAEARAFEAANNADAAIERYEQALRVDADFAPARQRVEALRRARTDDAFNDAMSAGYAALQRGDLGGARSSFERARRIRPSAPEVQSALRQVTSASHASEITRLLAQAAAMEQNENWQEAVAHYAQALKIDANLSAALDGRERAAARQDLDTRLKNTLSRPERLADDRVYQEAVTLQEAAAAVSNPGPRLGKQLVQLRQTLAAARAPLTVTLRSNNQTDVTVYRVADLGRFESHSLMLIPGRYTAVGKREGYRDVRVEFTVSPAAPPPTVVVECQEKVAFGSASP